MKNADRDNYLFWDDEYDDWTTRDNEKTAVTFAVVEPPEDEPDVTGLEVRATLPAVHPWKRATPSSSLPLMGQPSTTPLTAANPPRRA